MKINRKTLIKCLDKVFPAISTSTLVPEFTQFRFIGDKVQATDGSMTITTGLPRDLESVFQVPAKTFLKLLRGLKEEEIELTLEDSTLNISTNKLQGTFSVKIDCKLIPENEFTYKIEDSELIDSVIESISFCRHGISSDETTAVLCGVILDNNIAISSDGYKIVKSEILHDTEFKCSVPIRFSNVLVKYSKEVEVFGLDSAGKLFAILADGTSISSLTLQGELPNLLQYFPALEEEHDEFIFKTPLTDLIERHVEFTKEVDTVNKDMLVELKGFKCTFTSKKSSIKQLVEEVELETNVKELHVIEVNPTLFLGIVKNLTMFRHYKEKELVLLGTDHQQVVFKELRK